MQSAWAESKYKIQTFYQVLNQSGGDGFQIVDGSKQQDLSVQEPTLIINAQLTENLIISGSYDFDTWTSASDKAFDQTTTASLNRNQDRTGYTTGVAWKSTSFGVSLNVGRSEEWDYTSNHYTIGGYKTFAQDNFTLGISFSNYDDENRLFDYINDEAEPFAPKNTQVINIDMAQILTTRDLLKVGMTKITQTGALVVEGSLEE